MLSPKVVIQRIDLDRQVTLFMNLGLRAPWSFECHRKPSVDDAHPDIFPFVFPPSVRFQIRPAGGETQVSIRTNRDLWFADDYAVPGGMLIAVLFPFGYVPEVLKFKEKPHIPTLGRRGSVSPPGQINFHFNQVYRRAAIAFHISRNVYFGFKCVAKYHSEAFPCPRTYAFCDELFDTLGEDAAQVTVTRHDLDNFRPVFRDSADLGIVAQRINELLAFCRSSSLKAERDSARAALGSVLQTSLTTSIGTIGSITTVMDSYNTAGVVNTVISRLLAFFAL